MAASELAQAARAIALAARNLERAASTRDLTLAQYRVLAQVAAGDERSSLLAERLAVAKPTITAVVDGLVERGYLERSSVHGDRRSIRIAVTKSGRQALRAAEVEMTESLAGILEHVGDREAVLRALADLDNAMRVRMEARLKARADAAEPGTAQRGSHVIAREVRA
jgi:DNA-binding MarR family transcriptional regulator